MPKDGIGVGVLGLSVAFPPHVRRNDFWPASFVEEHAERAPKDPLTRLDRQEAQADVDPEVARHAVAYRTDVFRGTKARRVLADDLAPSDLEAEAGRKALAEAGIAAKDVDLLIVYSVLQDFPIPANHALVADKLGLPSDVAAWTLMAGCASFVPHLHVASQLIAAGEYNTALIIQSAVVSRIQDYQSPYSVIGGDGATAAVIGRVAAGHGYIAQHQLTRGDMHGGLRLLPTSDPNAAWYRGSAHRSDLTLTTSDLRAGHIQGAHAASLCREACAKVLDKAGYRPEDVGFFAVPQPTGWFGTACCEALGIPVERTISTFEDYGHIMASSAPLNLWAAHERGKLDVGDLVLVYCPGAGFVQSAALFRWSLAKP
jgi:3-oxoacyl-[acyl-carrier-protein] synthase III